VTVGLLDALRGGTVAALPDTDPVDLSEELTRERATNELLTEALAELELALDDQGWTRLASQGELEFTRDGMRKLTALCQLMAIKNPLIKRGLALRFYYVWGDGLQISARATGQDLNNPAEQDVNAVVQDFLDDKSTTTVLSGPGAHATLERCLGVDGNFFVALFTSPLTGKVVPRLIPFAEIVDVITNPDDRDEHWFYKRRCITTTVDPATGKVTTRDVVTYHPAVGYWPATRPKALDGAEVLWDAPVVHAWAENKPLGWKFGIPDAYAAIDWARAYKTFLEDWATLIKALSRFAWRATAPGSKQAKIRKALAAAPAVDPITGANQTGAAVMTPDITLEAIPKSGATIDSESGRPLAAMVAAGLDVPVTMLLGDPGTTGARATAETLDRPTELMADTRRALWTGVWKQILGYVIDQAVIAPRGPLKGVVTRDGDRLIVTLAGDTNPTVDVDWPDLDDDIAVDVLVKAIALADQTEKLPPLVVARLLLQALGVAEPDEILDELTDEDGNFIAPASMTGQAAVDAFNQGGDPAAVVGDTT
jgi:hypothetical protein